MDNLKAVMFLIPVLALIIVIVLFIVLTRNEKNKKPFTLFVLYLLVVAFVLNFLWELLQYPLYKQPGENADHIIFCGLASIADAIMVLLIYLGLAVIYNNIFWIKNLNFRRAITVILLGGIGAVLAEMRHLAAGSWAYNDSMPVIPYTNTGLVPVLQFMVLPLVIFLLSRYSIQKIFPILSMMLFSFLL